MSNDYIISLESKGVFNSTIIGLNSNFSSNIKHFEKKEEFSLIILV